MGKVEIELEIKNDIGDVVDETEKLEDGLGKAKKGVKSLAVGFKSLVAASGIVFLLNEAFTIFKEVLGKNQKVMDFMKTTTTALSIAFNDFFKFLSDNIGNVVGWFKSIFDDPQQSLKDFGQAIKDNLLERFNSFLDTIGFLASAVKKLFARDFSGAMNDVKEAGKEMVDVWTGVDGTVDKVTETVKKAIPAITEYTKSVIDTAVAMTETDRAAERAGVTFAKLNAQYLKEAEEQRQIRDDVSKTMKERIDANNKLSETIIKQQKLQREQLDVQEKAAQLQYDMNASDENWIILQEAKIAKLELEEAITGQLSEQKTNAVGLEQELLDLQNTVRAESLSGLERELEELETAYKLKLDMARKAGMDTAAIDEEYAKQRTAVIQANVADQLDAYAGLAAGLGALAGENKELAAAEAIISTWAAANRALASAPPPLNYVNMAAVIATGLANVSKIYSTDVGSGGGGTVTDTTPAPTMLSGDFSLSGGTPITQPVQAYVVTDDMTNSQDKLALIRRRATI